MTKTIITTNKREIKLEEGEEILTVHKVEKPEVHKLIEIELRRWFCEPIKKKELTYELGHNWISVSYRNITGCTSQDVGADKLICSFNYNEYIQYIDGVPHMTSKFIAHIINHLLYRLIETNQNYNIINQ